MKLIVAMIPPAKLEAVQAALIGAGVFRLTITEVFGFGRQLGYTEVQRGREFKVNPVKKLRLEIALNEDLVEDAIGAIRTAARTEPGGHIGDGKIFVLNLEECIRIRTGESGPDAI